MAEGEDKITTQNITEGAGGTQIDRKKYEAMRRAILLATPRELPGIPFKALADGVQEYLPEDWEGSVMWYVTTVKLDLEARGEIVRVADVKPQHLIRRARRPRR